MPRETITASEWDGKLFAETSAAACRRKSDGVAAEAFRFMGTLGNYHAIDQWTGDLNIWWEPEASTLKVDNILLEVGDYLIRYEDRLVRHTAAEFANQFTIDAASPSRAST